MKLTTVLFDLDGTLLPMDLEQFLRTYISDLCRHAAAYGLEPEKFSGAIRAGIGAMMENDGSCSNYEAFWNAMTASYGSRKIWNEELFESFYQNQFPRYAALCGKAPQAAETVRLLKERGIRVALATNPMFPVVATAQRIAWTGLRYEDFALVTSYENSSFSKPKLDYYRQVLSSLQVSPEECVMVGNDVGEDMCARELGMEVFLLTDCLINRKNAPIEAYPHGSFDRLQEFLLERL